LGELVFAGLGLFDELDMSLRALEEVKTADYVFAELYTSIMAGLSLENLEKIAGKKVILVSRKNLEDENGAMIISKASSAKVVFLVPGDPLIATTHIDLRIRADKMGIKTRIVHGASIISAVMGLSGLQNYRFGRSVTIPFPYGGIISETPYNVIVENKARNLHTLCFLDIDVERKRFLTVREALQSLLTVEKNKSQGVIDLDVLAVAIARAGSSDVKVKADRVANLLEFDFGAPPYLLVFPAGRLHFMEAEALIRFADAPEWIKEMVG